MHTFVCCEYQLFSAMNRRTFLRSGTAMTALVPLLPGADEPRPAAPAKAARFTSNPDLPTLLPPARWPGTPLDAEGRFQNHEFPYRTPGGQVLKWMLQRNPQREEKKADPFQVPIVEGAEFLAMKDDVVVWLGHASFFVRLGGINVLIDPVFGAPPFGKRLSRLPLDPARFTGLDYVLVSHAHYDHCDKDSLQQLHRQNPRARLLTGLGMPALLRRWLPEADLQAAGWYQQYRTDERLRITFVPSRHWSNRSLSDVNETLWGGFVLQGGGRQVYFNGDSGYGSHYRDIGQLFPGLDVALLGAGAYAPRWFMAPNHQDPAQAVQAFHDLGARTLVPMHYGTFDLSDEPPGEPVRHLHELAAGGKLRGQLRVLGAGEVVRPGA
ncbi:MBL fold metallo-hydrolase [Hymenobacter weizhouensis]|uniref:MBL fold metallo-hydrolase n=1 Tax=Hymenobacter sp. YIM 151500-1 TaxID=2987689 RepID=UPI002227693B|nr:MBL fold metallo-hydrolase [Hymenobacter sp. YIM 151500-1]UYZ62279.1 MBL fold metallo-hydrolase [Hymenobacter sp. YIM 151500-1]